MAARGRFDRPKRLCEPTDLCFPSREFTDDDKQRPASGSCPSLLQEHKNKPRGRAEDNPFLSSRRGAEPEGRDVEWQQMLATVDVQESVPKAVVRDFK